MEAVIVTHMPIEARKSSLHFSTARLSHLLIFDLFKLGAEFGAFFVLFTRLTRLDRPVCVFERLKQAFLLILFFHFGKFLLEQLGLFELEGEFEVVKGGKLVLQSNSGEI